MRFFEPTQIPLLDVENTGDLCLEVADDHGDDLEALEVLLVAGILFLWAGFVLVDTAILQKQSSDGLLQGDFEIL